jgi:hypothetical protein
MSLILKLRKRESHAGTVLVHPTSEHVVLGAVFGIVKNLSYDSVLNPWLARVTNNTIPPADDWHLSFWESQPVPAGVGEGSTEVDLEMDSEPALVFTEVKMDAAPTAGTTHDANRNQLVRNLDIGYEQAAKQKKRFAVIYVTPDESEPAIVDDIRKNQHAFPANPQVPPDQIRVCLYWCPWRSIGSVVHEALERDAMDEVERSFAFDLLAYLKMKGLWNGPLSEKLQTQVQGDKLYKELLPSGTFVPYGQTKNAPDQSWRNNAWAEADLRQLLALLPDREKALLKVLAEAPGAATKQSNIFAKLPFLGTNADSLSALKRGTSKACKGKGKAPLLIPGTGSGNDRVHRINPGLGTLLQVVIDEARKFQVSQGLIK